MSTSTTVIIDSAESRAEAVRAQRQKDQTAAVEAARDTIGRSRYEAAKARLPQLERAIRERWRPQLERVAQVAAMAGLPLPWQPQQQYTELSHLCDHVPQQLRQGLREYEALTPRDLVNPAIPPSAIIGRIQIWLNGSDGVLHAGNQRRQQLEEFLKTWPA